MKNKQTIEKTRKFIDSSIIEKLGCISKWRHWQTVSDSCRWPVVEEGTELRVCGYVVVNLNDISDNTTLWKLQNYWKYRVIVKYHFNQILSTNEMRYTKISHFKE